MQDLMEKLRSLEHALYERDEDVKVLTVQVTKLEDRLDTAFSKIKYLENTKVYLEEESRRLINEVIEKDREVRKLKTRLSELD